MATGDQRTPEQLQADLELTRADLAHTVDALQGRLRRQARTGLVAAGVAVASALVVTGVVVVLRRRS